jgi:hypothetical protein
MLLGCGIKSQQTLKGGWVKEGISSEQLREDYKECYFTMSQKKETVLEEYEEDKNYCKSKAEDRESKREAMRNTARGTDWIPFVGLGFNIAHDTLMGDQYYRRCMRSKGYLDFSSSQCMEEKGYQWKE